MPLYEYRCGKCGRETEVLQKLSDPPLARCPSCRGKLTKLLSRTSFQLKGGGWYAQGYGRSGSKSDAGSGEKKKSEGSGKPEGTGKSEDSGSSDGSAAKKAAGAV